MHCPKNCHHSITDRMPICAFALAVGKVPGEWQAYHLISQVTKSKNVLWVWGNCMCKWAYCMLPMPTLTCMQSKPEHCKG